MKICLIYNFAQHYRSEVFQKISRAFDCDFYFGKSYLGVKQMDYTLLRGSVNEFETRQVGRLSYKKGILKLLRKDYSHYIVLGETRDISIWLFALQARFFYPKKKVFFWSHGWYGKESMFESALKSVFFRLPNGGVFLYGNYARDMMIKRGFDPMKLFVIHNSLAYDEQLSIRNDLSTGTVYRDYFKNNNSNLFFIGRLTSGKKLDMILRAMVILREHGEYYNLTLIGDGEKREELEALARDLELERNVWFYGPCYNECELSRMIYNADLCVSPGNVGLTAIHSMVFGTPVLTHSDFSHQGPEFEAIHENVTGSFFKVGDIDSLAECISRWCSERNGKREQVRQACMDEVDKSWNPYYQLEVLRRYLK